MNWQADKVIDRVRAQAAGRLAAACYFLQAEIRQNISVPSRTVSISIGRNGKTKKVLGPRGSNRSRPGEFPHKDYGTLRTSIAVDVNREALVGRVGSNLPYARYLEFGTSRMAARPFIRRTLAESKQGIIDLMVHGSRVDIQVG